MSGWPDARAPERSSGVAPGPGLLLLVLLLAGCGGGGGPAQGVRIDLEKSNPEPLVRFYFGSYASPEGADPFEAGLVRRDGGAFYLDLDRMDALHPGAGRALREPAADGVLGWDDLEPFFRESYYRARRLPARADLLRDSLGYRTESAAWQRVEIDGVMTEARRVLFVPSAALRAALRGYRAAGDRLLYPAGSWIVGEHRREGTIVETTAMRKRADGYWDYVVYDRAGRLAPRTETGPKPLDAPTHCTGCHFGTRLFEPEKSFPAEAPPGPHGPRAVYVGPEARRADVTAFFDEHRKRSDHILGPYNTLFVSRLLADRDAGRLGPEDAALLDGLGL